MKPNCPSGFCFEKISTFISLPISQASGNNGHEQQNTNKFFILILISKIDTSTIRSHIITDAMINGNPFSAELQFLFLIHPPFSPPEIQICLHCLNLIIYQFNKCYHSRSYHRKPIGTKYETRMAVWET